MLSGRTIPQHIDKEFYLKVKKDFVEKTDEFDKFTGGVVGFCASYNGIFFGAFSGVIKTKTGVIRNYIDESWRNIVRQSVFLKDVEFICSEYDKLEIPPHSIIYCDPPYKNTFGYKGCNNFNHEKFYDWCREMHNQGHKVYVSEYEMPDDFKVVWQKQILCTMQSTGVNNQVVEKLFTLEKYPVQERLF